VAVCVSLVSAIFILARFSADLIIKGGRLPLLSGFESINHLDSACSKFGALRIMCATHASNCCLVNISIAISSNSRCLGH